MSNSEQKVEECDATEVT